ncbi:MAG: 4Fe-4S binding protein [Helicobacter sp.]|nr:4Fe-4S binding protein [Helicobacter sp.]
MNDNNNKIDIQSGGVLFPHLDGSAKENFGKHAEERAYSVETSFKLSVAHWRVDKPVFNKDTCINCYFCWVYCPDSSILVRDEKMSGIDYVHCKGCGICADVCPSNPKSLIMFNNNQDLDEALSNWPAKAEKKSKAQNEGN